MSRSVWNGLAAAALMLDCVSEAQAMLYSGSQGYEFTSGSGSYEDQRLWAASSLRLEGGWYPFARISYSRDTTYQWIASPTVGLEKGLEGVGRLRAGYTYYRGSMRVGGFLRTTHALELGWLRAFTDAASGDLSYHMMTGDLFSSADVLDNADSRPLAQSVYHEAALNVSYTLHRGSTAPRLTSGLAVQGSAHAQSVLRETAGVSIPVGGGFSFDTSASLNQGDGAAPFLATGGITYGFSGRR